MTTRVPMAIAVVLLATACSAPAPTATTATDPENATTSQSAPQVATLGSTLTITAAGGTAAYTVANLSPVPVDAQIIPATGTMYAVDVTIDAQIGTTVYNGFYFVAAGPDGSNLAPAVGAVKPGITSGQLDPGQSIAGHVAFDVPLGQTITQVALRDPKGKTLAVWGPAPSG
ncbi:MAG: DUF1942 domain-containing protein [Mycobacterium sp.]